MENVSHLSSILFFPNRWRLHNLRQQFITEISVVTHSWTNNNESRQTKSTRAAKVKHSFSLSSNQLCENTWIFIYKLNDRVKSECFDHLIWPFSVRLLQSVFCFSSLHLFLFCSSALASITVEIIILRRDTIPDSTHLASGKLYLKQTQQKWISFVESAIRNERNIFFRFCNLCISAFNSISKSNSKFDFQYEAKCILNRVFCVMLFATSIKLLARIQFAYERKVLLPFQTSCKCILDDSDGSPQRVFLFWFMKTRWIQFFFFFVNKWLASS